ncbi:hypothetical protein RB200_05180 [Streptomyces sp. PmtG]
MSIVVNAPVAREHRVRLGPDDGVAHHAAVYAQTLLTLMRWPGSVVTASIVTGYLVDNAYRFGRDPRNPGAEIVLRLAVADDDYLLVAVTDHVPSFPNFLEAVDRKPARDGRISGLCWVRRVCAQIHCVLNVGAGTKTVQALLAPGVSYEV